MSLSALPGLDTLSSLGLPIGSWVIFGSGPMVIRGMRQTDDLDILVRVEEFDRLLGLYPEHLGVTGFSGDRKLALGTVEVCDSCPGLTMQEVEKAISDPDTIEGLPFLKLSRVVQAKQYMKREKDVQDIEMIEAYLAHSTEYCKFSIKLGY